MDDVSDSRLLLIRIRPAREPASSNGENHSFEVEAILDYESIYPASPFELDSDKLQSILASPNNEYGQFLGRSCAQLRPCSTLSPTSDRRIPCGFS